LNSLRDSLRETCAKPLEKANHILIGQLGTHWGNSRQFGRQFQQSISTLVPWLPKGQMLGGRSSPDEASELGDRKWK
jgi:hypothetical protein